MSVKLEDIEGAVEKDGMICIPKEQAEELKPPPEEEEVERVGNWVCPRDPRFQQVNVTNWCFQMYIDFHRCAFLLGKKANDCSYFQRCYEQICPKSWVEAWDDQVEKGTFPRDLHKDFYYRQP